ncbi:hypothetical protein SAMN04487954_10161 [Billgrantia gudaonensis]|uniref:Uncharacterized protein n=1 Tax=Billgrantia gudaonensis TaxID=376427 RepID=A0A1G8MMZ5_9GAMM|nr:hypothetical protein SAMN04487954_10161 [Halomonas gudaonensis]
MSTADTIAPPTTKRALHRCRCPVMTHVTEHERRTLLASAMLACDVGHVRHSRGRAEPR